MGLLVYDKFTKANASVGNLIDFSDINVTAGTGITINGNEISASNSISVATSDTLGGIKIGYPENVTNRAVKLSSEKAYIELQYASDSNAGIIKTSSSSSDDSTNSQVKYPLKSSSYAGYVPVPYASSNNRGVVQLSDYSNINTDIANKDDVKAVTPRAINSVAASAATKAVNNKMWFGTKAQYGDLATKDPNVLYFITY